MCNYNNIRYVWIGKDNLNNWEIKCKIYYYYYFFVVLYNRSNILKVVEVFIIDGVKFYDVIFNF